MLVLKGWLFIYVCGLYVFLSEGKESVNPGKSTVH